MERGRGLAVAGVVTLAVVDVVLVTWAFRPASFDDVASRAGLPGAESSSDAAPARPPASPTADPSPSTSGSAVAAEPLRVVLAAVDGGTAWVARTEACEDPAEVWVTTDGGGSWSRSDAPGSAVRVRASSGTEAFLTGGDEACDLSLWGTVDAGGTWGSDTVAKAWSRVPDDARAVHTAVDTVVRPCGRRDVLDLAPLDDTDALVACAGGAVRSTDDSGESWTRRYTVRGLLALGLRGDGTGLVASSTDGCDGVLVVPVDGDGRSASGTCVDADPEPGRVAIAATADGDWLVVGDTVLRRADAGADWTATESRLR
ncbi:beta propeller repeat protein [Phycicoccus flavus]|uniref:Uncharacterized protein n=1 Tax=Phycicoccus flavus TaxID=2502783 RepID=A0A8T6R3A3_9MICO|nr:hypothetical protein [Phycicoccus flavus]NHA66681.1 hypothetical protein [Phycicoccus flavus]